MRAAIVSIAIAVAAASLASCGSDDEGAAPPTGERNGAFPVTVTHRFGTTTVPARPRRIAVVGLTEQDIVLALGEKPVATTEWYGNQPYAVWPWARADYRKLSAIATTVAGVPGGTDYFSRWDDQTVLVAQALGKEAEGRALVKRIKTPTRRPRPSIPSSAAGRRASARTPSPTGSSTSTPRA